MLKKLTDNPKLINTARKEYNDAVLSGADKWVPANGGLEIPAKASDGTRYIYCVNPARAQGRLNPAGETHGWLNLDTDIVQFENPYAELNR